jgi:hypothetical protein
MWVIGGYDGAYKKDVWYSSDGVTWTEATGAAGWTARRSHTSVVFDGKMWVIGGIDGALKNDVWRLLRKYTSPEPTTSVGGETSLYYSTAYIESSIYDAGSTFDWTTVSWSEIKPSGTNIVVKVRSDNDNDPRDGGWSGWLTQDNNVENPSLPDGRYVQYRVELSTAGNSLTPKLYDITLNYQTPPPNVPPNKPTSLLCEGSINPTHVTDNQPEFSAIGTDNDHDDMNYYALQVDDDSGFGSPIWDNTKTAITTFDNGVRCSDISYAGSSLTRGTTYYWRIKFWDNNGNEGTWSTTADNFRMNTPPTIPATLTLTSPKVGEILTANASGSFDAEGDPITCYYKFYNENHSAIRRDWSTTSTYTIIVADAHDNIRVFAKARDGYENSGEKENSILIANSLPTTPTSLTLTGSKVGQVLTATASGSTDNDNDNITYYYRFINRTDNVERKAYSTSNTYTIQAIDTNDNIRVFAKARDGYENSGEKENSVIAVSATITITVTTDNASYDKGQIIKISGTAKNSENAPVGSGTVTISIVNGSWSRTVTSAIANGAYSASYFITFDNPEGTWTISASAVDNYGSVTSAPENVNVTVIYPVAYRYYVVTFLSPTADQTSFSRGQAVTVMVQITEDNEKLSGANVVLMTPRGDNVRLTEGLVGVYSVAYTLLLDDPTGDWYMTVIGEKTEGGVFKAGASLNIVSIAPATLSLTLISPTKREFEAGETVEVTVEARYSDGSPVDEGIIVVNKPSGENLPLTAEGGGIYGATYIIGGGEVGTWNIQVSAVDAYGNLGSKTMASTVIVPAGASSYVIKYWPVVLAAILGLVVASAFVARCSLRARRLGAIKGEKQEIERLRKEATLNYFKNGLISRETYDNLTKEYATKLTNLDKEERILMDKMKKKKLPEKKGR